MRIDYRVSQPPGDQFVHLLSYMMQVGEGVRSMCVDHALLLVNLCIAGKWSRGQVYGQCLCCGRTRQVSGIPLPFQRTRVLYLHPLCWRLRA